MFPVKKIMRLCNKWQLKYMERNLRDYFYYLTSNNIYIDHVINIDVIE